MTDWNEDAAVAAYMMTLSETLDLPIADEYKPGVIAFLKLAAAMAETLEEAPLDPDDASLAPVFRLPGPQ